MGTLGDLGCFSFQAGKNTVDIRVASSDTVHGEMMVLRLLDKSFAVLDLARLGFMPESASAIIEAVTAYATVGEIADGLRAAWGVHRELITV